MTFVKETKANTLKKSLEKLLERNDKIKQYNKQQIKFESIQKRTEMHKCRVILMEDFPLIFFDRSNCCKIK